MSIGRFWIFWNDKQNKQTNTQVLFFFLNNFVGKTWNISVLSKDVEKLKSSPVAINPNLIMTAGSYI